MTDRLYYTDAYRREFTARIRRRALDPLRVYLDQTAFYPTSGGQPHDVGTIDTVPVIDVIDEGDEIAHVVGQAVEADDVRCQIDWARRFDFMQQHTGQHLLSAIFADVLGYPTLSVHFGDQLSTLDLETPAIDPRQLSDAEKRANTIVAENRPVQVTFEDASKVAGLRKASDRAGILRIVSIADLDRSACGGTHVRSTAEIGAILLRRQEKVKQTTRIEFSCGLRAARRARADFDALAAAAQTLSASVDDVPALVQSQSLQLKDAEQGRRRLAQEVATWQARDWHAQSAPDAAGVRRHVRILESGALDDQRNFAVAMSNLPQAVAVIAVRASSSIMVSASADSGVDAGAVVKAIATSLGGRGGGSQRLAQAVFPNAAAFETAVSRLGA